MTHDDYRDVLAGGTRVAEFRVERLLGRGGFGATYLAWDAELEAWRAVKEYLPNGWRGEVWGRRLRDGTVGPAPGQEESYRRGLERFVGEGRVLANSRLNHPRIVRVWRCFKARGTAYLVMEHVEGRSLKEALEADGGWWPEVRVRPLLSGLADGLSAVHAAGLLHRDVSPHNVMLRAKDDSPVLIDFGTVRKLEQGETGSLPVLKHGYAAIEQYKDDWEDHKRTPAYRLLTETDGAKRAGKDQGAWTDVYGLGAVAYEALSGTAPKRATLRLLHDTLGPVSAVAPGPVSGELASAVDAALSMYPWRRPQSIGAWSALWHDEPSVPSPPPELRATEEAKNKEGDRRWWLYGAAAALVAATIALASFVVPPRGDTGSAGTGAGNVGTNLEAERAAEAERRRLAELHRPGRMFRDTCPGCPEMVVVPAGTFTMGSPDWEEGRYSNEGPQRRVAIGAPFAVGVHEVTFAEWDACVSAGGCGGYRPADEGWGRGRRPVINVSWANARSYVGWLSERTGSEYRLPSESEWEYVTRAGTTTRYWWGDSVGGTGSNCRGDDCGDDYEYTAPVGSFGANAFGLFDVSGNVWEWVADCWHASYRGAPTDGSVWTGSSGCVRVLRGGSWRNDLRLLRSALRNGFVAGDRYDNVGFRVARTLD